ncbi:hypothetical protein DEI97_013510 [Curtobacterium sp. MCLR17_032]|uniref:hypothetical protein n=1 Tax=Curtobacterium sp. MCLR17_032 TaxID=2175650 RepID=UPI000DA8D0F1|nr:hypothetical protein [Curtobacterium sp. MCLR17_032]WIE60758.1 hypothetical protein DEI97_013510 [Curtobacterium sp. MCLR17_032]
MTNQEQGRIDQSILDGVGERLLESQLAGQLDEHIASWGPVTATDALGRIEAERTRVRKYDQALIAIASDLRIRALGLDAATQ